jgi:hypothetical protein
MPVDTGGYRILLHRTETAHQQPVKQGPTAHDKRAGINICNTVYTQHRKEGRQCKMFDVFADDLHPMQIIISLKPTERLSDRFIQQQWALIAVCLCLAAQLTTAQVHIK